MPNRYYTPNLRNFYEDYAGGKQPRKQKNKLMLEKSERLYDQLIKAHINKKTKLKNVKR